jgi:hypothetical protein
MAQEVEEEVMVQTKEARSARSKREKSSGFDCWNAMIGRCYRPKRKDFEKYGGAGIKVCDRWRFGDGSKSGFACFIDDMGKRPSIDHTIDRTIGAVEYGPQACRWATRAEQQRNRRNNIRITVDGITKTASEWARDYGIAPTVFISRVRGGWDIARALHSPVREKAKTRAPGTG